MMLNVRMIAVVRAPAAYTLCTSICTPKAGSRRRTSLHHCRLLGLQFIWNHCRLPRDWMSSQLETGSGSSTPTSKEYPQMRNMPNHSVSTNADISIQINPFVAALASFGAPLASVAQVVETHAGLLNLPIPQRIQCRAFHLLCAMPPIYSKMLVVGRTSSFGGPAL